MSKNFYTIAMILNLFIFSSLAVFANPVIDIPDKDVNFGEVLPGKVTHHSFVVKNNGTTDLIISEITPSCGCTTALLLDKTVPPGKSVQIEADITAQQNDGIVRKTINVVSNDPKIPTFIIYFNLTVKSDFKLEPAKIDLAEMFIGEKKSFKFLLKQVNKKTFDPSKVEYSKEVFKVDYKALDANNPLSDIEFSVEYYASAIFGPHQAYDMIKIFPYKDDNTLSLTMPFSGTIKGYIQASATSIFRSVAKGKGHKETVNIKHIKDLPFAISSVTSSAPNITTNIVKLSDSSYDLELILKEGILLNADGTEFKKQDVAIAVKTDQIDTKVINIYMTILVKR